MNEILAWLNKGVEQLNRVIEGKEREDNPAPNLLKEALGMFSK
jgi:hypothetical protein